ncbi:tetratricopeptide repeat protein [bacterium]|nr:tetratricopeptide repeat protein [bacterium]
MRTAFLFISLLLALGPNAKATTPEELQKAFSESYTYETNGKYTEAINVLKKVYDASSYEINLRLGWLHYLGGLFTESSTYYKKAVELKTMSIEAKLGYVLPEAAMGNWEKVKNTYLEIIIIDANNYTANYRLGSVYYGQKDYKTAYKYFQKIVNLYPFDYDALLMFAWTNFQLGKVGEAKILFQKVLLYSPNDESAQEGLGLIE